MPDRVMYRYGASTCADHASGDAGWPDHWDSANVARLNDPKSIVVPAS